MGAFDLIPLGENLRPFLPLALAKLGISIDDANVLNSLFDLIVELKDSGKVSKVGDLLTNPEIAQFLAELKETQGKKELLKNESEPSSSPARFKVFLCPSCKKFSYINVNDVER